MKLLTLPVLFFLFLLFSCSENSSSDTSDKNTQDSLNVKTEKADSSQGRKEWVIDNDSIFTEEQRLALNKILSEYEQKTSNELAVITVKGLDTFKNIADLGRFLANDMGIGKKDINNGLLITFCKSCKEARITTGLGTEKILSDKICTEILEKHMNPHFRKGAFVTGIEKGTEEIIRIWGDKH